MLMLISLNPSTASHLFHLRLLPIFWSKNEGGSWSLLDVDEEERNITVAFSTVIELS